MLHPQRVHVRLEDVAVERRQDNDELPDRRRERGFSILAGGVDQLVQLVDPSHAVAEEWLAPCLPRPQRCQLRGCGWALAVEELARDGLAEVPVQNLGHRFNAGDANEGGLVALLLPDERLLPFGARKVEERPQEISLQALLAFEVESQRHPNCRCSLQGEFRDHCLNELQLHLNSKVRCAMCVCSEHFEEFGLVCERLLEPAPLQQDGAARQQLRPDNLVPLR
mmetsp:Transcript_491/g.1130  ORF Transcript_491/g.1130 Transcript_491/m.1130 type:complete len:224 (-) Transcript_491:315-986(-)